MYFEYHLGNDVQDVYCPISYIYISFHFHGEVIHSLYMYIIKEMYPIKYQLYFHSCQNANIIVDVSSSRHISLTSQLNITQRNLMSTPEKATFCVNSNNMTNLHAAPVPFRATTFFYFFSKTRKKKSRNSGGSLISFFWENRYTVQVSVAVYIKRSSRLASRAAFRWQAYLSYRLSSIVYILVHNVNEKIAKP
jgi:hypothetical protein